MLLDRKNILANIKYDDVFLEYFLSLNSTNDYLRNTPLNNKYHICIAEKQLSGKGRFNRAWISPFAENLYYSLKINLNVETNKLFGLSLTVAVSIVQVLSNNYPILGTKIKIKWPNDIYVNNKKLAGILIEAKHKSNGCSQVIIGIGINVNMSDSKNMIDQAWSSLIKELNHDVDRSILAINISNDLIKKLHIFERNGFKPWIDFYKNYDCLQGKSIKLMRSEKLISGVANGVNELGQLRLKLINKEYFFSSGEFSIIKN